MKIKAFAGLLLLCSILMGTGCVSIPVPYENGEQDSVHKASPLGSETTMTVGTFTDYLLGQKEHYPISDEFIEKHQQLSGGYIKNAKNAGIVVDKQQHSPNQKWHFFESWYYACLEEGTISREDDAKSRIYMKLLCPELLLWMYEACGVAPVKVKRAFDAAVAGKEEGLAVTSIAKKMREQVSWEDIMANFGEKTPATGVTLDKTSLSMKVGDTAKVVATVTPGDTTETPIWSVVSGQGVVTVAQNGREVTLTAVAEGSSTLKVSFNEDVWAECTVTVTDTLRIEGLPSGIRVKVGESVSLTPALSKGEGTFAFLSQNTGVATVSPVGVVAGVAAGQTAIEVTCVEHPDLAVQIPLTVIDTAGQTSASYNIVYDLGDRTTAKQITDNAVAFATLVSPDGDTLVASVDGLTYVYGGANGGSGDNRWYTGDTLKIGATSQNGKITFVLDGEVNYVKITGYAHTPTGKIQVGDSADATKATTLTMEDLTQASKATVEAGEVATILVTFEATGQVSIETLSKKPLFITAIEFGYDPALEITE